MHKKRSLFRFLASNYVFFTALNLAVMSLLYLGFTAWQRHLAPVTDPEGLIRRAESARDGAYRNLNAERYLGRGSGAVIFDSDGRCMFEEGGWNEKFAGTDFIPDFRSGRRYYAAKLPEESENGFWLIAEADVREGGEPSITGYMLLDEAGKRLSGTLFPDCSSFSEREIGYLRGRDGSGRRIWKHDWTDENGEEGRRMFWMQQTGAREYREAYAAFGVLKWVFIPVYLAAALVCIRWLDRRTKKLLQPLNEAILSFPEGSRGELETYRGPEEFSQIARNFLELERQLEESERERQRLDREKRRLFADLSHDLKTPVTVISGYACALRDGMVPEAQRQNYLDVIAKRAVRLGDLLQSFHEYSRLEHPGMRVKTERSDLCGEVRDYFAGRYQELELRGYFLKASIPAEPVWCGLDQELFGRVLDNLVNNALKYNPEGTTLFVEAGREENRAALRIGDDGRGIPPELQDSLFSPFVTGDVSRGKEHGSGLGLSIVREIVRLHGGEIRLEKTPSAGKKTEFLLTFPLWEDALS